MSCNGEIWVGFSIGVDSAVNHAQQLKVESWLTERGYSSDAYAVRLSNRYLEGVFSRFRERMKFDSMKRAILAPDGATYLSEGFNGPYDYLIGTFDTQVVLRRMGLEQRFTICFLADGRVAASNDAVFRECLNHGFGGRCRVMDAVARQVRN